MRCCSMHAPEMLLALILMASLTFYVLLGGADYGGGVWDLLAIGPRMQEQRELISNAITPVWEANHVWLILVVVLLFAGFPTAFAAITTALNIPLTVLIVGIVMRGSSFVFRAYHTGDYRTQRRRGLIFAIASTVTPICLWVVQGATASYAIAAFIALLTRKYKVARIAAILQVGLILWGWGLSQSPFLLQGEMTVSEAAAAPPVLWALISATAAGLLVLFPSIWYLMQLFKANDEDIPLH